MKVYRDVKFKNGRFDITVPSVLRVRVQDTQYCLPIGEPLEVEAVPLHVGGGWKADNVGRSQFVGARIFALEELSVRNGWDHPKRHTLTDVEFIEEVIPQ